jgi:hypothetical protein
MKRFRQFHPLSVLLMTILFVLVSIVAPPRTQSAESHPVFLPLIQRGYPLELSYGEDVYLPRGTLGPYPLFAYFGEVTNFSATDTFSVTEEAGIGWLSGGVPSRTQTNIPLLAAVFPGKSVPYIILLNSYRDTVISVAITEVNTLALSDYLPLTVTPMTLTCQDEEMAQITGVVRNNTAVAVEAIRVVLWKHYENYGPNGLAIADVNGVLLPGQATEFASSLLEICTNHQLPAGLLLSDFANAAEGKSVVPPNKIDMR